MRIKTNISTLGQIYIPKKERERIQLNTDSIDYIADSCAILLIPSSFTAEQALESLKVIQTHLKHEIEIEKKQEKKNVPNPTTTRSN